MVRVRVRARVRARVRCSDHICLLREAEPLLALLLLHSRSIHSEQNGMHYTYFGVAH